MDFHHDPARTPSRHRMVLLTWLAIYPQVLLLSWLLRQLPLSLPPPVSILITTGIAVPMLGYVLMPRLTRLLDPWLSAPSGADVEPRRRPPLVQTKARVPRSRHDRRHRC